MVLRSRTLGSAPFLVIRQVGMEVVLMHCGDPLGKTVAKRFRGEDLGGLAEGEDKAFPFVVGDEAEAEGGKIGRFLVDLLAGVEGFGDQVGCLMCRNAQANDLNVGRIVVEADADDIAEVGIGRKAGLMLIGAIGSGPKLLDAVERVGLDPLSLVIPGEQKPTFVVLFEEEWGDGGLVGRTVIKRLVDQFLSLLFVDGFVEGIEPLQAIGIVGLVEVDDGAGFAGDEIEAMFESGGDAFDTFHLPKSIELFEDGQSVAEFLHIVGQEGRLGQGEVGITIAVGTRGPVVDNGGVYAQFAVAQGIDIVHNGPPGGVGQITADEFAQGLATGL